jgi:hypothetical protein
MSAGRGRSDSGGSDVRHVWRVSGSDALDALKSFAAREHVEHRRHAEDERLAKRAFRRIGDVHMTVDQARKKCPIAPIDLGRTLRGHVRRPNANDSTGVDQHRPMLQAPLAIKNANVADDESLLSGEWSQRTRQRKCYGEDPY